MLLLLFVAVVGNHGASSWSSTSVFSSPWFRPAASVLPPQHDSGTNSSSSGQEPHHGRLVIRILSLGLLLLFFMTRVVVLVVAASCMERTDGPDTKREGYWRVVVSQKSRAQGQHTLDTGLHCLLSRRQQPLVGLLFCFVFKILDCHGFQISCRTNAVG